MLSFAYFRTFEGFQVLVEKDWVSFGHPFLMRCGHLLNHKEDDVSPIFLQFLDCVYQLVRQFPHFFEFNTRYVLALADQIHSCRFGTFLMNCDADRVRTLKHVVFSLSLLYCRVFLGSIWNATENERCLGFFVG